MNLNPNNLLGWAIRLAVAVGAAALWAFATSSMPGWVAYGGVGLVALWVVLQAGDLAFRTRRAHTTKDAPAEEVQEPAHAAP